MGRGSLGGGAEGTKRDRFAHWVGKRRMQGPANLKGKSKIHVFLFYSGRG